MANKKQKHIVDIGNDKVAEIEKALKEQGGCYIRNFGKFTVMPIKARRGYNPIGKNYIDLPQSKRVVFQLSQAIKRNI